MEAELDRPIPTPPAQRRADFRQRRLPALVWLVSAALCAWLLFGDTRNFEYVALAQAVEYEVSAPIGGKLDTVFVDLYDAVDQGEVVAQLSDAELTARLERSRASIRMLRAELVAQQARLQTGESQGLAGRVDDLRRFHADEANHRLAALELRAALRTDEVQLERLERLLQRARPLLESGVIDDNRHDEIRLERDGLARHIEENRGVLAETEQEYEAARARRHDYETSLPELLEFGEPLLAPYREAIAVETQRLREIEAQRDALVLKSPIDGQISAVLCRQGQAVLPGEAILTITDPQVRDIVAWLDETDSREIRPNTPVVVTSRQRPGRASESFVVRVGSGQELLPERLWPSPSTPIWGRAVVIAALPDMALRPNELLAVRFDRR